MADGSFDLCYLLVHGLPGAFVLAEPACDGFHFVQLVETFRDLAIVMTDEIELCAKENEGCHQVVEGLVAMENGNGFIEQDLSKVFTAIAGSGVAPAGADKVKFAGGQTEEETTGTILLFCHMLHFPLRVIKVRRGEENSPTPPFFEGVNAADCGGGVVI